MDDAAGDACIGDCTTRLLALIHRTPRYRAALQGNGRVAELSRTSPPVF